MVFLLGVARSVSLHHKSALICCVECNEFMHNITFRKWSKAASSLKRINIYQISVQFSKVGRQITQRKSKNVKSA